MTPPVFPRPVFRFAPTPNGRLHLGHAYSALLNDRLARMAGGVMLLRIEDVDTIRARPDHVRGIIEDLVWLGIPWHGPVMHQSGRTARYQAVLDGLIARGLAYPSAISRAELAARVAATEAEGRPWPRDPDGAPQVPPDERDMSAPFRLPAGKPVAWRLNMAKALALTGPLTFEEHKLFASPRRAARADAWGDPVLKGKDGCFAYTLAVVVDDADQGVTDVVRGADLLAATGLHRTLQTLLGFPAPRYRHHKLVTGPDGTKLAKSRNSPSLADMRRDGRSAADVRRLLGFENAGPDPSG